MEVASRSLQNFLSHNTLHFPVDAFELLRLVLAFNEQDKTSPLGLRLTDLDRFEEYLEDWALHWEHGSIVVLRGEDGDLSILGAQVHEGSSKKRKRGEDDESQPVAAVAGSHSEPRLPLAATMNIVGLSKADRAAFSILSESTAKAKLLAEQHASTTGVFEPICSHITRDECIKSKRQAGAEDPIKSCNRVHFRPLIRPHTEPSLGHCSYLNTCYSEPTYAMSPSIHPLPSVPRASGAALPSGLGAGGRGKDKAPCRYLHFEVDLDPEDEHQHGQVIKPKTRVEHKPKRTHRIELGLGPDGKGYKVYPPQWLNCDLRHFDYSVLGKFHVIMADPPWDIHMSLPYGTMTDDEMRSMPIPMLQDEGLLFLWVTGRAMEVGRECLRAWGYHRIDEIVWVKTNQLQRVIRTGRTGHWLNHTKEHMLVCVKLAPDGSVKIPSWVNRGLDVDVIVSEVRETSRKPDEAYGLIERMCPGGRKVEIFGRKHNARPGWLTLGNQLGHDQIYDDELADRILQRYPDRELLKPEYPEQA